jgi:hypothetical protein
MNDKSLFAISVNKTKFPDYYSVKDNYSLQTFAGFARSVEEMENLLGMAYEAHKKLRLDILSHYDVFLAGQRSARKI